MEDNNIQAFNGAIQAYSALRDIMLQKGAPSEDMRQIEALISEAQKASEEDAKIAAAAEGAGDPERQWLLELRERRLTEHKRIAASLFAGGCGGCSGCGS